MNNTALRAEMLSTSGACLAMTEAEHRPLSADNIHMVFADEEHESRLADKRQCKCDKFRRCTQTRGRTNFTGHMWKYKICEMNTLILTFGKRRCTILFAT